MAMRKEEIRDTRNTYAQLMSDISSINPMLKRLQIQMADRQMKKCQRAYLLVHK